jgi:ATP-dependent DNA helicase RecG
LSGVGEKLEQKMHRIGIFTISDLLFHLPFRYIDRTRLTPIGALRPGQEALLTGTVELTQVRYGRRRSLLCHISDGTGAIMLRFFYFTRSQQERLEKGALLRCWGAVRRGPKMLEIVHPEYQHISAAERDMVEQSLTPVYPATEGLAQARLRRLTDQALKVLERNQDHLAELLPREILREYSMPDLLGALSYVHRPPPDADQEALKRGIHASQQRLAFEEMLAHHLSLCKLRREVQTREAPVFHSGPDAIETFISRLPFRLTGAQQRVVTEITGDLRRNIPMLRLVQGDVGSGKTVIAAVAALQALANGYQVAFMAPTELLADQHLRNLEQWLDGSGYPVMLLSGKVKGAERKQALQGLASGQALIAVGTHALFQKQVAFGRLGLIIIDEQHRFGVHQRFALFTKGESAGAVPHQLVMTATPIPRTLAMTVFADLDLSVVDELPPGRKPVNTVVISNERRQEIIDRIAAVCRQGRQVYWVCTLIDESDNAQYQAATETHEYLQQVLPGLNIGLIHGRMSGAEKEQNMTGYKSGAVNLLVATTVIEVGVDVPAASLMIIENAERLGLSQLHQLRGRVGRGDQRSDCVLMYQPPLSETGQARLEIMRSTTDGFEIAKKDMELRGPGEILGTRQTGLPQMRIADLVRDARLIPRIQEVSTRLLEQHPEQVDLLIERWIAKDVGLSNV